MRNLTAEKTDQSQIQMLAVATTQIQHQHRQHCLTQYQWHQQTTIGTGQMIALGFKMLRALTAFFNHQPLAGFKLAAQRMLYSKAVDAIADTGRAILGFKTAGRIGQRHRHIAQSRLLGQQTQQLLYAVIIVITGFNNLRQAMQPIGGG